MSEEQKVSTLVDRIRRNLTWLFSSQVAISLIGLMTLAVTARALGATNIGILTLAEAVILIVGRVLHFEPWQAVIKYGTEALEEGDFDRFRRLIKFSIAVDVFGGLLAGLTAILIASIIAPLVSLPVSDGAAYISALALGLFFPLRPTAVAVLRIHDRFDRLAIIDVGISVVRLVISIFCLALGLGLWAFIGLLILQFFLNGTLPFAMAMHELRARGQGGCMSLSLRPVFMENPGLFRFLWNSNVNVILRQSTQRLDVLFVGALLNPTSVGFYQIGKRIMTSTVKLGGTLRQVLFPEMARLLASGQPERFWTLLRNVTLGTSIFSASVFVLIGLNMAYFVELFFGPDFRNAVPAINILFFTSMTYLATILLNPAMLCLGLDSALVRISTVATIVFAAAFVPLTHYFDVEGAASAHALYNLIWISFCVLSLQRINENDT